MKKIKICIGSWVNRKWEVSVSPYLLKKIHWKDVNPKALFFNLFIKELQDEKVKNISGFFVVYKNWTSEIVYFPKPNLKNILEDFSRKEKFYLNVFKENHIIQMIYPLILKNISLLK